MGISAFPTGENLSAFSMAIGLSTIQGITGIAGQAEIMLRIVSGNTLQVGGQSLTWGTDGMVLSGVNNLFRVSGTLYCAATGATVVISGWRTMTGPNQAG